MRELALALRARVTWVVAALAALLVGHGFVLAVDLYSAASRSALAGTLQARELDPLAGIVRPTLGGVDLALVLLGPIVAARTVSVEKERATFGALCLQVGSPTKVLVRKTFASFLATSLILLPAVGCCCAFRLAGGHVDVVETTVAIAGEVLHLALVVAVAVAGAAWSSTFAQAVTIAVVVSLSSWMIDVGEGFAALAWLGRAEAWSIETQLVPSLHGIVAVGAVGWLLAATAMALALAVVGVRLDWTVRRRIGVAVPIVAIGSMLLAACGNVRRAYDWSEQRRASLPPDVVVALRGVQRPIAAEVFLDRDDSRRRQLSSDVLSKLLLARPDASISFPLDAVSGTTLERDARYGVIVLRVGDEARETRSTSRREIVTLVLEAAGATTPDWTMPLYAGFPTVVSGRARDVLVLAAYGLFPLGLLGTGFVLTRRRSRRW